MLPSPHTLFVSVLLLGATSVCAQNRPAPSPNPDPTDTNNLRLVGKRFPYDQLPFKVDTADTARGIQVGYNQCNSTTEGQNSLCQTLIVNSIDDFCLWGPQTRMEVGNAEAGTVAFCTKAGHGARRVPAGALTAVQFIRTPSYIAVMGKLNQELINIPAGDSGGELDSGGQDLRGNPIGGVAYSLNMPSSPGTMSQSPVWHYFVGGDEFCMKLCDVKAPNALGLCEHVFDTFGCRVNVPGAYRPGVFESCIGDDQNPVKPGLTDLPATSSCTPFQSADLFADAPAATGTSSSSASTTPGNGGSSTRPGTSSSGSSSTSTPTNGPGENQEGSARGMQAGLYSVVLLVTLGATLVGAAVIV